MLERRVAGIVPAKPHTAFRQGSRLLWEECLTRDGFDGPFTMLYHEQRPHEAIPDRDVVTPELLEAFVTSGDQRRSQEPVHEPVHELARRHFRLGDVKSSGAPSGARRAIVENDDVIVSVLRPSRSDELYFSNGDADELYYLHRGGGTLITAHGVLELREGDYVGVPRGVLRRFELDPSDTARFWVLIETTGRLDVPTQYRNPVGQLRMDAPYTHRDFRAPDLEALRSRASDGPREFVVKRGGNLYGFRSRHCLTDAVGWDGTLYPVAFSIHDFQPKVGRVHLPPNVHGTFAARGVLVCSFVPRLADFDPNAIPCPYPHSSVDIDEVLFYSRGDFTSRRGVDEGSLSYHPAGIPHGPHPGAYEASVGKTALEELAVMLDCARPLRATSFARGVEDAGYHDSFVDTSSAE